MTNIQTETGNPDMTPEEAKAVQPEKEAVQSEKSGSNSAPSDQPAKKKKRKRRLGDRPDGYRVRTINPMNKIMPYIMPMRCDACNTYSDMFDVTKADEICRQKKKEGKTNFSFLHILLAAYIRAVSQRPALNRFVSGQKIYAHYNIDVAMTVKKELSAESPDTCVKIRFEPDDTLDEVYEKFNSVVSEIQSKPAEKTDFDKLNKALTLIPGLFLRWTVKLLNFADYFGLLPKWLIQLSPFHGSMIVTSMGSLGIRPIYHHIYNFGNLPVFIAYGSKRSIIKCERNGNTVVKKCIEVKVVTDERICDGFYYASAFKIVKRYVETPELLNKKPEQVFSDID